MQTPETPEEILILFESRMAALGMTQSQLDVKAFGKQGTSSIQNLKKGADPSYSRVAALARALGLELYLGLPRVPGLADPPADSDFHLVNIGKAGYLTLPWAEPGLGKGSAPVAVHGSWLESHSLIPDRLSAVVPDISLIDGVPAEDTVAILEKAADRRGSGQTWCIKDRGKVILARLAFIDGGFVIMPARLDQAPRVVRKDDPDGPYPLGRVALLAAIQPA